MQSFDPVRDVEDFHKKFGINYDGKPRALPMEVLHFREMFMDEEKREYASHSLAAHFEAYGATPPDKGEMVYQLDKTLDALVDLVYVVIGTAHLHGFDFRAAWDRVHAANMAKEQAKPGKPISAEERMKLKMIKPLGWEPPSHRDLVEDNAHVG